jgi:hypothetical protein
MTPEVVRVRRTDKLNGHKTHPPTHSLLFLVTASISPSIQAVYGSCMPYNTMNLLQVGMKLLWSSRNQKFIGHAMTHDELASLSDVYVTLSPDYRKRQTNYVLQTLWRDLTSDFDVIGPHFTSDGPFSHEFLCRILMESMHQFHVCGFETVAVVSDGAAPNMTMMKEMSGSPRKAFRYSCV